MDACTEHYSLDSDELDDYEEAYFPDVEALCGLEPSSKPRFSRALSLEQLPSLHRFPETSCVTDVVACRVEADQGHQVLPAVASPSTPRKVFWKYPNIASTPPKNFLH